MVTPRITAIAATLLLSLTLVLHVSAQPSPPAVAPSAFVESFDGAPTTPQDYTNPHGWDIMTFGVDSRQPNLAQHGASCEAPGFPYSGSNTHSFSTDAHATFICNNHLMTSLGITGYGAVYMTPPAVADFSSGTARIAWDMSTLRTSSRDWVYVTLTPFGEHHEMPYLNTDQHIPPHNIRILLGGANTFLVQQRVNGQDVTISQDTFHTWNDVFRAQTPPVDESAARRDTFELSLTRSTFSFCMPNYLSPTGEQPFCWARNANLGTVLGAEWGGQAAVQFTHVTYNAEKSCEDGAIAAGLEPLDQYSIVHNAYGDAHCPPNTWHWDNVSINPAVPFSVVSSVPADLTRSSASAGTVAFAAPAPAGAFLSFVSFGDTPQLRVSFDGGTSWLTPHFQEATSFAHPEVGEHVFTPIPAGQQSVMVRGGNGYWGSFEAQAFKIISPPNGVVQLPTPLPTSTATPPVPSTSTPTLVPRPTLVPATDTPTPVVTATATATVTPTPPPTPTPGGVCSVTVTLQNGALHVVEGPC